jgi:hypothetical protein
VSNMALRFSNYPSKNIVLLLVAEILVREPRVDSMQRVGGYHRRSSRAQSKREHDARQLPAVSQTELLLSYVRFVKALKVAKKERTIVKETIKKRERVFALRVSSVG